MSNRPAASPEPPGGLVGLLVAGGHGRRAGGPKALKPMQGELLWRWQVQRMRRAGCAHVAAVLHPTALPAEDLAHVSALRADADAPMFASVQLGLRALQTMTPTAAVLLLPVDCPMPNPAVAHALWAAAEASPSPQWAVVRPRYGGRHGHPLLLAPRCVARLLEEAPASGRLDRLLQALPEGQALTVDVDSADVLANFNVDGVTR